MVGSPRGRDQQAGRREPGFGDCDILVVDHDPVLRRAAAEALQAAGYRVIAARGGQDALRVLDTEISREVYGDSAVRVGADARAIASALSSLLVVGPTRDAALAAGRRRLGAFSWTRSADLIAEALAQAAR